MLDSLKKLITNLQKNDSRIFDEDINHDAIKDTLAVLMVHVSMADKKTTQKENEKILGFFQQEFQMSASETHELFETVVKNIDELEKYLDRLNELLSKDIHAKAKVLQHLNNLIICDGCVDIEYDVFETIRVSLI